MGIFDLPASFGESPLQTGIVPSREQVFGMASEWKGQAEGYGRTVLERSGANLRQLGAAVKGGVDLWDAFQGGYGGRTPEQQMEDIRRYQSSACSFTGPLQSTCEAAMDVIDAIGSGVYEVFGRADAIYLGDLAEKGAADALGFVADDGDAAAIGRMFSSGWIGMRREASLHRDESPKADENALFELTLGMMAGIYASGNPSSTLASDINRAYDEGRRIIRMRGGSGTGPRNADETAPAGSAQRAWFDFMQKFDATFIGGRERWKAMYHDLPSGQAPFGTWRLTRRLGDVYDAHWRVVHWDWLPAVVKHLVLCGVGVMVESVETGRSILDLTGSSHEAQAILRIAKNDLLATRILYLCWSAFRGTPKYRGLLVFLFDWIGRNGPVVPLVDGENGEKGEKGGAMSGGSKVVLAVGGTAAAGTGLYFLGRHLRWW